MQDIITNYLRKRTVIILAGQLDITSTQVLITFSTGFIAIARSIVINL